MSDLRPAVFLDRDGTIIVDSHYISRVDDVRLLPGAAEAIAELNAAAIPVIIISNQSGIGRGYFSEDTYRSVQRHVEELLAVRGAFPDAVYHCPHAPDSDPRCDCRKPGTALFQRAAQDHHLDLERSWYIGDRWRDVHPALTLGGRGLLVPSSVTPAEDIEEAAEHGLRTSTLSDAVRLILGRP